jgi:hypothetical protein
LSARVDISFRAQRQHGETMKRARHVAWLAAVGTSALCATARAQTPASASERATTFVMRMRSSPSGDGTMGAAMAALKSEWTANVVAMTRRGRIDIVEGGQPGIFEKGDYLLFDSVDVVLVKPSEKAFSPFPVGNGMPLSNLPGMQITLKNVKAALDSSGAGETLAGRPTQKYRVVTSYGMTMSMPEMASAGVQMPEIEITSTIDYWLASATVPSTPFTRLVVSPPNGSTNPMTELLTKLAVIMRSLPAGTVPLRTITATRMSFGAMGSAAIDQVVEMSDLSASSVDLDRLTIPKDFSERPIAGLPTTPTPADSTDKWRSRP